MNDPRHESAGLRASSWRATVVQALGLAALSMAFVLVLLDVDRHEWHVPIHDSGDALLHQMAVRHVIDNGWSFREPRLNAPFGMDLRDFPAWDVLSLGIARAIALFTTHVPLVVNITFMISFPLLAVSAFLAMRWIGLRTWFAAAGALIYTFLPYHLIKGIGHLFLTNYVLLPPALALAVIVARGDSARRSHYLVAIAGGALFGLNGVYYPAFALIVLAFAVLMRIARERSLRGAGPAIAMMCAILVMVAAFLLPVVQRRTETSATEAGKRHHPESELYALKPVSMLLPVHGHRISALAELRERYATSPLYFENGSVALGAAGVAGLLLLFLHGLGRLAGRAARPTMDALTWLAVTSIAWASLGGFSSLFALILTPQIRTWSRMVVVIAFFATAALMRVLQLRMSQGSRSRAAPIVCTIVALVALVDQASPHFQVNGPTDYPPEDQEWLASLDAQLPGGAAVFQFPPFPYPENGRLGSAEDYDYFRPYLLTRTLSWSYGATRGGPHLEWQRQTAAMQSGEMNERLAAAGFSAMLVDRFAFEGSDLAPDLPTPAAESPGGRWALYAIPPNELSGPARLAAAFGEPLLTLEQGISYLEETGSNSYHWASPRGTVAIHNLATKPREVMITFRAAAAVEGDWQLTMTSGDARGSFGLDGDADELYRVRLTAPPGRTVIEFRTTAPRLDAPADPRVLAFRLYQPEIHTPAPASAPG